MDEEENNVNQDNNGTSNFIKKKIEQIVKKWLLKFIIIAIIVIVIVGSVFLVFNKVGDAVQETVDKIVDFFTIDYEGEGTIEISDEQIDAIINSIEAQDIDLEDLMLKGETDETNEIEQGTTNEIEEKSEAEKEALREYIRKFYEAQAVTQTLNTKPSILDNGKVYGTVYIYRINDKDSTEVARRDQLDYISYEKMEEKKANQDADIIKYFSVNSSGQLVVPEIRESNSSGSTVTMISLKSIDYKSVISQYTTQMNFFIYLTMITGNPNFVSAVTDLVKDSEIHITIMDSVTTETTQTVHTYTENSKSMDDAGIEKTNDPVTKSETTVTTTEVRTPVPAVTYARTWFCEQTIEYNIKTESNVETNTTQVPDQEEPELVVEETSENWTTGDKTTVTSTKTTTQYEEATRGNVIDRTGEKGDGNSSFIGLLDVKFKIPNKNKPKEAAGENLVSQAEWLFELLKKDSNMQNLEQIMRYVLYKYTGNDYGVTELDLSIFDAKEMKVNTVIVGGNLSAFGTNLTREEFIQLVEAYEHSSNYDTYMKPYAEDFYDVCTENNVNPALAFAHACLETGYGSNSGCQNDKNYFGMAHYNGASSGSKYSTVAESIEDYCKWVINNATPGTSAYSSNCSVAQEYATVESKLNGTPDTNIYVLYCRYAQLNATHDGTWGGPEWFTREVHGKQCEHKSGSPTTVEEKAAYAVYTTEQRVSIAKTIFGQSVFVGSLNFDGETVEAAGYVFPHYLQADYAGAYGTSTIASSGCGPTSLAMILAGIKGDSSITPITVVENINDYWPDGSYYVPGVGSSHCIFNNDFISKYYGVTSQRNITPGQALDALENGYPVIGREDGHILAIIPAPDEYKSQGYKFYILDSARGHDGPYKTHNDANAVVSGNLDFLAIIIP